MDIGNIFIGIGVTAILGVLAYLLYTYVRLITPIVEYEEHMNTLEICFIDKIAQKHGINLEKEMEKKNYLRNHKLNIRRQIREEVYNDFFSKEEIKGGKK